MRKLPQSDSLRAAMQMHVGIGGMRIGRDPLTQQQVNTYLLARLENLEHNEGKVMAALQRLGIDHCDECDEWLENTIRIGDRCQCLDCFNWEHFLREDDTEDVHNQNLPLVIKACRNYPALLKSLPSDKSGKLDEPFLTEYRKQTGNFADGSKLPDKSFVIGRCIEAGDDEEGNTFVLIHTTREQLAGFGRNLIFQNVRVELSK